MRTLGLLALLLSTLAQAQAPSRRAAQVTPVDRPPVLDAVLDEWSPGLFAVTPPVTLTQATTFLEEGGVEGDADHSADVWLATTPGWLHLAARVTDDDVRAAHAGGEQWRDDGLELLLARPDGGLWHLGLSPTGGAWLYQPAGAALGDVKVKGAVGPPGYTLEASIPLAAFGAKDATLDGWRFNLAARDVDGDASAHRVWSGYRHGQRSSLGQLFVGKKAPPVAAQPPCPVPKLRLTLDHPLTARGDTLYAQDTPVTLRLVNYQPAAASWDALWTDFDVRQVAKDLELAARLGANGVRLFVFYAPFGEHQVKPEMLARLKAVIDVASSQGLVAVVSFFPFDKEFRPKAWPGMAAHVKAIVSAFQGHPGIAMWDLMNEPDHAWASAGATVSAKDVAAWAAHLYQAVKAADPTHLVTVGLAGHFATRTDGGVRDDEALPFVDVVSVHGYFDAVPLADFLGRAKRLGKPVVLQEYGRTRLYWTQDEVAAFDEAVCQAARGARLAGVGAWELLDHPVETIDWYKQPWREGEENWFGLATARGEPLPRARVFCRCLDAPRFVVTRPKP